MMVEVFKSKGTCYEPIPAKKEKKKRRKEQSASNNPTPQVSEQALKYSQPIQTWGLMYKTFNSFYPKSVRMHKSFQIYKTMRTPAAQNSIYKTQSAEYCVRVSTPL